MEGNNTIRRYDIDWLRVIMFGLLIPFHIGIGFSGWNVYPYENNESGGGLLLFLLAFMHQWRLPVLFLISGMGTFYALKNRSGKQFSAERVKRLLLPLFFALNFIIIFQGYFAALHEGESVSFGQFAIAWWSHLGFGQVQHLWFLGNLFIYSLLALPLFLYVRNHSDGLFSTFIDKLIAIPKGLGLLFLIPIPLVLIELFIKPWSMGFVGQGYEFFWYFVFFIIGYFLIVANENYWNALVRVRYSSILFGVISSLLLFLLTVVANSIADGYGILILSGGWILEGDQFWNLLTFPMSILHALNAWFWCLAIFSWGAKLLNKDSKILSYLNQAVYPFYILHMTFILITLFFFKEIEMHWISKMLIMNIITFSGCWLTYELVKRNKIIKMLFGIKSATKKSSPNI